MTNVEDITNFEILLSLLNLIKQEIISWSTNEMHFQQSTKIQITNFSSKSLIMLATIDFKIYIIKKIYALAQNKTPCALCPELKN